MSLDRAGRRRRTDRRIGWLLLCLWLSFLYCALFGLLGAGSAETFREWVVWLTVWGGYWSILAVLQVR